MRVSMSWIFSSSNADGASAASGASRNATPCRENSARCGVGGDDTFQVLLLSSISDLPPDWDRRVAGQSRNSASKPDVHLRINLARYYSD